MKSLKNNFDLFSSNKYQKQKNNQIFSFQTVLNKQSKYQKQVQQNTSILTQIHLKNNALNKNGYNKKNEKMFNHPNYLTFCQKYSDLLYQKYTTQDKKKASNKLSKKDFTEFSKNYVNQQQILFHLHLSLKRFFQHHSHHFCHQYQLLSQTLCKLKSLLAIKNKSLKQKSSTIIKSLNKLDLIICRREDKNIVSFCNNNKNNYGIKNNQNQNNRKITQFKLVSHDSQNYQVNSFNKQRQNCSDNIYDNGGERKIETKLNDKIPIRAQKLFKQQINNQNTLLYTSPTKNNQNSKQKVIFLSNFITPKSPNLLSGYQSNSKQQLDQQNLTIQCKYHTNQKNSHNPSQPFLIDHNLSISFKKNPYQQYQQNPSPTLQEKQQKQLLCQTLKYSESQFKLNSQLHQQHNYENVKFRNYNDNYEYFDELPYSPVQPYRQRILQEQNLNAKHHRETNKGIKQQQQIYQNGLIQYQQDDELKFIQSNINSFLNQQNQQRHIKQLSSHFVSLLKQRSAFNIHLYCQKTTNYICQAGQSLSQIIQKASSQIQEQKLLMNQQWNNILQCLGKDMQEIQLLISQEKKLRDIKDKKFLQNLQNLQTQLIEEIFQEKQQRKQEDKVLTQMLSNLVQSLQNID